jgi:hypothetical protein
VLLIKSGNPTVVLLCVCEQCVNCFMFYVYFEKSQIRIENDSAGPNNAILNIAGYKRFHVVPGRMRMKLTSNSLKTSVCSPNRI